MAEKQNILLVEDDPNLGMLLQDYLQLKGKYNVTLAVDGDEGLKAFTAAAYDLVILDVMMPRKDGFTLGKEIRTINKEVPIIFATAKGMMEDKTEAFGMGGDDYIVKPFRIEELLLRINALLRRSRNPEKTSEEKTRFSIGKFDFDYTSQMIRWDDQQQKLSTKEADLLRLLCIKQNDVLTREEALLQIWHDDNYFNGRSMDVFLSKIRKYLKDDPSVEIVNVHGKGYKLLAEKPTV